MTNYTSYIKNITTGEWLESEASGKVTHTKNEDKKLVFSEESDAESTLEYLNFNFSDAYVLLDEENIDIEEYANEFLAAIKFDVADYLQEDEETYYVRGYENGSEEYCAYHFELDGRDHVKIDREDAQFKFTNIQ